MGSRDISRQIAMLVLMLGIASVSLGQGGCEGEFPEGATPPPEADDTQGEATRSVTVVIPENATGLGAQAYGENPLILGPSTMVTWVNTDTVPHTVTANSGLFDSGQIAPGTSFSFTFTELGLFQYFCEIHGPLSESGTVQIVTREPPTVPAPTPTATLTPLPTTTPDPNPFPIPAPTVTQ